MPRLASSWKKLSPSRLNGWWFQTSNLWTWKIGGFPWGFPMFFLSAFCDRFSFHGETMLVFYPHGGSCQFSRKFWLWSFNTHHSWKNMTDLETGTDSPNMLGNWHPRPQANSVQETTFHKTTVRVGQRPNFAWFCTCVSYNWIPWPKMTQDSLCFFTVTANRGNAKAEIQKTWFAAASPRCQWKLAPHLPWIPGPHSPHESAVFSSAGKATDPKLHRGAWNKSGSGLENLETFRPSKMRRGDGQRPCAVWEDSVLSGGASLPLSDLASKSACNRICCFFRGTIRLLTSA